jgi:hypothetical protein
MERFQKSKPELYKRIQKHYQLRMGNLGSCPIIDLTNIEFRRVTRNIPAHWKHLVQYERSAYYSKPIVYRNPMTYQCP